jgi:hypothetical protein
VLKLSLLHPTRGGHDQVIQLDSIGDGRYSGAVDELTLGNWYLQLEADDWRLPGSLQVPDQMSVVLSPAIADGS